MSSSADKKLVVTPKVVLMMSKITEHKLNGPNYLDRSKMIPVYLRSLHMTSHLIKDPPTNDSKEQWMEEDARLFLQICNFIDSEVLGLINHRGFVKELMDYLEFVFSGKGIFLVYSICVNPFVDKRSKIVLSWHNL